MSTRKATDELPCQESTKKSRGGEDGKILRLHLELTGSDLHVWRELEVAAGTTLRDLHGYIQALFGWLNSHLYKFENKKGTVAMSDAEMLKIANEVEEGLDDSTVTIGDWLKEEEDSILYEYDFGDSWQIDVALLEARDGEIARLPHCLGGERLGPPDDCGGINGFENLVRVMSNKDEDSQEYAELLDWLEGEHFDVESFDLAKVNKDLKQAVAELSEEGS